MAVPLASTRDPGVDRDNVCLCQLQRLVPDIATKLDTFLLPHARANRMRANSAGGVSAVSSSHQR